MIRKSVSRPAGTGTGQRAFLVENLAFFFSERNAAPCFRLAFRSTLCRAQCFRACCPLWWPCRASAFGCAVPQRVSLASFPCKFCLVTRPPPPKRLLREDIKPGLCGQSTQNHARASSPADGLLVLVARSLSFFALPRRRRPAAGVFCEAGLGAAVRVPRRSCPGRPVSAREVNGRSKGEDQEVFVHEIISKPMDESTLV